MNDNLYLITRVIDDNSTKVIKELKKQNKRIGGILCLNGLFIGLMFYDLYKTKKRLRELEGDC